MSTFVKKASTQTVLLVLFVIFLVALLVVIAYGYYHLLCFLNAPSKHYDLEVVKEDKDSYRTAMLVTGIVSVIGLVIVMGRGTTGKMDVKYEDAAVLWKDPPSDSVILCDLDPTDKFEECEAHFPHVLWYESMKAKALEWGKNFKIYKNITQCCTDKTRNITVFTRVTRPSQAYSLGHGWVADVPFEYCFTKECTSEFYRDRLKRNEFRKTIEAPKCEIKTSLEPSKLTNVFTVQFQWQSVNLKKKDEFKVKEDSGTLDVICDDYANGPVTEDTLYNFLISNPSTKIGKLTTTLENTNTKYEVTFKL